MAVLEELGLEISRSLNEDYIEKFIKKSASKKNQKRVIHPFPVENKYKNGALLVFSIRMEGIVALSL